MHILSGIFKLVYHLFCVFGQLSRGSYVPWRIWSAMMVSARNQVLNQGWINKGCITGLTESGVVLVDPNLFDVFFVVANRL